MNRRILLFLATIFLVTGCGGDSAVETGKASLEWQVAARDCDTAGVDQVQVTLEGDARNEKGLSDWTFDCGSRQGTVESLRPGRYIFSLRGFDSQGEVAFEGKTSSVEVRPGGTARPPTVVLNAAPASLLLQWNFGGPFCAHVGVTEIEVLAFDTYGTALLEKGVACDEGRLEIELRPGFYEFVVLGLDERGRIRYDADFQQEIDRGEDAVRQVVLR